ncbi:MAG TPA: hypothetical protein PKY82_31340 [Pyrinomonadaceae bacterium]|nr:hypothetical protein [Pyrinomonadaceae bacterium]
MATNKFSKQIGTLTGETVTLTEKSETNYIAWKVFPAKEVAGLSDEELFLKLGFERIYHGPGHPYSSSPVINRSVSRVLVYQHHGWDI